MIIDSDELASRVHQHGVVRLYEQTGRYDFASSQVVHRCGLLSEPDDSIRHELKAFCVQMSGCASVAAAVAGHLAECGVTPLFLLPQVHWEHELLDHNPDLWGEVLGLIGVHLDDPGLTGGGAVVLQHGQVPLASVIEALILGITDSSVMILADCPLVIKIHQHRQIWLSSTDKTLLPDIRLLGMEY